MGRIERGGGNGGEPVRSPPGRLRFRRPHAGSIPACELMGVLAIDSQHAILLGCHRRIPFRGGHAYNHGDSWFCRIW